MTKKTGLLIGIASVIIIGAILYFIVFKKKDEQLKSTNANNDTGNITDSQENIPDSQEDIDAIGENLTNDDAGSSDVTAINPKLDWVAQKKVAIYLSDLLQDSQMDDLKNWTKLIDKEQREDPNKWPDTSGLQGQVSDIGHALYQMKVWNQSILDNLKEAQK